MSETPNITTPPSGHPAISAPINRTRPEDLLEAYDRVEKGKVDEVKKEVDKQAKVAKELPKKIAADKLVEKLEERDAVEPTEAPAEESEGLTEEAGEEAEAKLPSVKAKINDEEIDIPEDALIPIKIGSQEKNIKLAHVIKFYENQSKSFAHLDRQNSLLDAKQKAFYKEYQQLDAVGEQIVKHAVQGQVEPVVRLMAALSQKTKGLDPVDLEYRLLEGLTKTAETWKNMTPDQKAAYLSQRKAALADEKLKVYSEREKAQEAISKTESEIRTLCAEHGLSESDFYGAYKALVDNQVGPGKLWASEAEIQAKDVIGLHQRALAHQAIQKERPELLTADPEILDHLQEIIQGQAGLTVEDVREILRTALGAPSRSVENLNRKVAKTRSQIQAAQIGKAKSQNSNVQDDYLSFYKQEFGKRRVLPMVKR